jgi:hypothetical protein
MELVNPDLFMNWVFLRRVERIERIEREWMQIFDLENDRVLILVRNQRMQSISENLDVPENLEKD